MLKSKKIAFIILSSLISTSLLISCSQNSNQTANNSSSSTSTNTSDSSNSDKNKDSKESVTALDAYKKINLGMTKDEVDKTLGLEAKADTNQLALKGTYDYSDPNTGYGVSIVYNDKNIAYAKTAIFNSHSELSPLCKKAVSEDQESKLPKGMDYKDVVNILGGDGIEMNATANENDTTKLIAVIRIWVNKDGSGLQVIFSKDDKVSDAMYFDHD